MQNIKFIVLCRIFTLKPQQTINLSDFVLIYRLILPIKQHKMINTQSDMINLPSEMINIVKK